MLARFGAVIISILTAVWLARAPDWEPLIAFLTAFGSYIGIEIRQRRPKKDAKMEVAPPKPAPSHPPSAAAKPTSAAVYPPLDPKCMAVLRFLANKSSGAWSAHVAHELKYSVAEVEFCFDSLRERRLIQQVRADRGSGAEYGATPEGRMLLFGS